MDKAGEKASPGSIDRAYVMNSVSRRQLIVFSGEDRPWLVF